MSFPPAGFNKIFSIYEYNNKDSSVFVADLILFIPSIALKGKTYTYDEQNHSFQTQEFKVFTRVIAAIVYIATIYIYVPLTLIASIVKLSNAENTRMHELFLRGPNPPSPPPSPPSSPSSQRRIPPSPSTPPLNSNAAPLFRPYPGPSRVQTPPIQREPDPRLRPFIPSHSLITGPSSSPASRLTQVLPVGNQNQTPSALPLVANSSSPSIPLSSISLNTAPYGIYTPCPDSSSVGIAPAQPPVSNSSSSSVQSSSNSSMSSSSSSSSAISSPLSSPEPDKCCICLESMEAQDPVINGSHDCQHKLHLKCYNEAISNIDNGQQGWDPDVNGCPLCRAGAAPADEHGGGGGNDLIAAMIMRAVLQLAMQRRQAREAADPLQNRVSPQGANRMMFLPMGNGFIFFRVRSTQNTPNQSNL